MIKEQAAWPACLNNLTPSGLTSDFSLVPVHFLCPGQLHLSIPCFLRYNEGNDHGKDRITKIAMKKKTTVLVVEDESSIRKLIATALEYNGYKCLEAPDGKTAILEASTRNPDVIFLDLGLPDMDGVEIIEKIRTWSNVPIIVVSARTDESDKLKALDSGADDYMTKPFSTAELLARLRVVERHLSNQTSRPESESVFVNGPLRVDYASACVFYNDEELHLTPIEFKLLTLLSQNVGRVLTHRYITENIWGSNMDNDIASLRVFMATLRKKLESREGAPQFIQTHIGVGYRMLRVDQ